MADPTDARGERTRLLLIVGVLAMVAALAAVDLVVDLQQGTTAGHAVVEGAIVAAGAAGIVILLRRLAELRRREGLATRAAEDLARHLAESRHEAERWRQEASELLSGLGVLIDRQLGRWGLTAAEKDVALLLLKGFSHKEIAALRKVGEATVRQQAAAIYRKAGVGGRHDLSAFFLEDLLAPRDDRAVGDAAPRSAR